MHAYATDSIGERKVLASIGILSILVVLWLGVVVDDLPIAALIPSPLALFGIFYILVDRVVWKWSFLNRIGIFRIPDVSGVWVGTLTSSHDSHTISHPIRVSISQTWSRICIRLSTEASSSHSIAAMLLTEGPEGVTLLYVYKNEPRSTAIAFMHPHSGTASLSLDSSRTLSGDYYSGRGRANHGRITISPEIKNAIA